MITYRKNLALLIVFSTTGLWGSTAHALYFTETLRWDRSIPVCFNAEAVARRDYEGYRTKIRAAVSRSWVQATGLEFSWQGQCARSGTPGVINIGLNELGACCGAQTYRDGRRVDINIAVRGGSPAALPDALVIHEFGHALGFEHETQRPDFIDYKGCEESNIKGGKTLNTIPDKHSVMNSTYCHQNPELSYWDIIGSQNYWGRQNYFADVTGDGIDDAIVVNRDGVHVRPTNFQGLMPASDQRNWTGWGFWGHKGTFFADVTGDRRADAIAVNNEGVFVRSSHGTQFRNDTRNWTVWGFWGTRGTYFADVTGDGRADAIAVNEDGVWVRPSHGTGFDYHTRWLASLPNTRSGGNFFADVNGPDADGKRRADLITVNGDGVSVNIASETGFSPTATNWTASEESP